MVVVPSQISSLFQKPKDVVQSPRVMPNGMYILHEVTGVRVGFGAINDLFYGDVNGTLLHTYSMVHI